MRKHSSTYTTLPPRIKVFPAFLYSSYLYYSHRRLCLISSPLSSECLRIALPLKRLNAQLGLCVMNWCSTYLVRRLRFNAILPIWWSKCRLGPGTTVNHLILHPSAISSAGRLVWSYLCCCGTKRSYIYTASSDYLQFPQ